MRIHYVLLLAASPIQAQAVNWPELVSVLASRSRATTPVFAPGDGSATIAQGQGSPREQASTVQSIEYSDWYERRLTIHRWASYAVLPLFAFQYAAGSQLYAKSTDAPQWAKDGHRFAATGVAVLFGVNTVTGVWNLWDSRKDPEGRARRTVHAVLLLAADAGFTATGLLAEQAERSPEKRRLHRTIALTSIASATIGYLTMVPPFRRD